jgi:hypothetical protein
MQGLAGRVVSESFQLAQLCCKYLHFLKPELLLSIHETDRPANAQRHVFLISPFETLLLPFGASSATAAFILGFWKHFACFRETI